MSEWATDLTLSMETGPQTRWPKRKERGAAAPGAVLFTVHFQAPGFICARATRVLGRLELEPSGHTRFIMTEKLGHSR